MTRRSAVIALCGFLAAVPCRPQDQDFTTRAREYERSMVRITTAGVLNSGPRKTAIGTGFVVARGGYILTANHVIEPEGGWNLEENPVMLTVDALDGEGRIYQIPGTPVVLYQDEQTDLALLRLQGFDRSPLLLGNSTYLQDGDFIGVMAFGAGRTRPWPGEGSIETVFRPDVRGFMDLVLENVGRTDSGSPLFDQQGRVVGVLLQGWDNSPSSVEVFGVPVNSAAPLLGMAGHNHPATLLQWLNETPELDDKIADLENAILELKTSWTFDLELYQNEANETRLEILIRKRLGHGLWPQDVKVEIVPIVIVRKSERNLRPILGQQTFSVTDLRETQLLVVNNLDAQVREAAEEAGIRYDRISRFEVEIEAEVESAGETIVRREQRDVYP
jgi:hypothetical protein